MYDEKYDNIIYTYMHNENINEIDNDYLSKMSATEKSEFERKLIDEGISSNNSDNIQRYEELLNCINETF